MLKAWRKTQGDKQKLALSLELDADYHRFETWAPRVTNVSKKNRLERILVAASPGLSNVVGRVVCESSRETYFIEHLRVTLVSGVGLDLAKVTMPRPAHGYSSAVSYDPRDDFASETHSPFPKFRQKNARTSHPSFTQTLFTTEDVLVQDGRIAVSAYHKTTFDFVLPFAEHLPNTAKAVGNGTRRTDIAHVLTTTCQFRACGPKGQPVGSAISAVYAKECVVYRALEEESFAVTHPKWKFALTPLPGTLHFPDFDLKTVVPMHVALGQDFRCYFKGDGAKGSGRIRVEEVQCRLMETMELCDGSVTTRPVGPSTMDPNWQSFTSQKKFIAVDDGSDTMVSFHDGKNDDNELYFGARLSTAYAQPRTTDLWHSITHSVAFRIQSASTGAAMRFEVPIRVVFVKLPNLGSRSSMNSLAASFRTTASRASSDAASPSGKQPSTTSTRFATPHFTHFGSTPSFSSESNLAVPLSRHAPSSLRSAYSYNEEIIPVRPDPVVTEPPAYTPPAPKPSGEVLEVDPPAYQTRVPEPPPPLSVTHINLHP
ncbi:hypothetical protein HKX48_004105 [Thoreauomyces humboldtii]|nr:hypothetical protein HKX48_004105 [Thoreauomyces humboldtii]